jgi:hypothetical protein
LDGAVVVGSCFRHPVERKQQVASLLEVERIRRREPDGSIHMRELPFQRPPRIGQFERFEVLALCLVACGVAAGGKTCSQQWDDAS